MNSDFENSATAILSDAAFKLRALGYKCAIGSLSLPQGVSLNLHVGESTLAAAAAYVAIGRGGQVACAEDSDAAFAQEVAAVITTDALEKAAQATQPAPKATVVFCLFCDDNDPWLLPTEAKDDFIAGRKFHVIGRTIHLGCSGKPDHDFMLDSLRLLDDGISIRAEVSSEADRIRSEASRVQSADQARRRNVFIAEITAELSRTSYRPFDAANQVIGQWENKLSALGFSALKAYIQRLPGRLVHQAADRMMAGETLQESISNAAAALLLRGMAKPEELLKSRKNRRDGYSPGLPEA